MAAFNRIFNCNKLFENLTICTIHIVCVKQLIKTKIKVHFLGGRIVLYILFNNNKTISLFNLTTKVRYV